MARKKSKKTTLFTSFWFILTSLIIVIGLCLGGFTWYASRPVSSDKIAQNFIVKKGESIYSIGSRLEAAGLIRSGTMFKLAVMRAGLSTKIQAGSFRLSPHLTVSEMALALTEGRQDIWVTILEGWRREEIAAAITTTFIEAGAEFDPDQFLSLTKNKEGYLFPDTYLFPIDATEATVASILESTLTKKIADLQTSINASNYSLHQILTMASLIEREARDETSRPLVAGILWKRLEADWPLQVDATLQYAKGFDSIEQTWWKPPLAADKTISSAYNTYAHPGLPPAPICSPSLSSIKAALNPKASSYWFYLTDTKGRMHYAETIDGHNSNIAKYL